MHAYHESKHCCCMRLKEEFKHAQQWVARSFSLQYCLQSCLPCPVLQACTSNACLCNQMPLAQIPFAWHMTSSTICLCGMPANVNIPTDILSRSLFSNTPSHIKTISYLQVELLSAFYVSQQAFLVCLPVCAVLALSLSKSHARRTNMRIADR